MLLLSLHLHDKIKLTFLQHKRLECKQLEKQISNIKKALGNDSQKFELIFKSYFSSPMKMMYHLL